MKPPTGYEFTLFLSFDLDADSAEALRGEDPATRSRGVYAIRRGVHRILELLESYGVKTTFFIPGWVAKTYRSIVVEIAGRGHEIAGHGYKHERLDKLSELEEKLVLRLMVEELRKHHHIQGFRAPYWRISPRTIRLLANLGITYDSSLMDDEEPYTIDIDGRKLVELPVDWRLDDWPYLEQYRTLTPQELLQQWLEEIREAHRKKTYIALTLHPQAIARGARINILENIVKEALKLKAWIPTGIQLAKHVLKQHKTPTKL